MLVTIVFSNGFLQVNSTPTYFNDIHVVKWHLLVDGSVYADEWAIPTTAEVYLSNLLCNIQQYVHDVLKKKCILVLSETMPTEAIQSLELYSRDKTLFDVVQITLDNLPDQPGTKYELRTLQACPLLHVSKDNLVNWFFKEVVGGNSVFSGIDGKKITSITGVNEILTLDADSKERTYCLTDLIGLPILK
jgi:hypothetical protein